MHLSCKICYFHETIYSVAFIIKLHETWPLLLEFYPLSWVI